MAGQYGASFKQQDEFKDKVLDLRRVTRVVAGGKRFRFRATVVIGDGQGRVGVGIGKSIDVPAAIAKGRAAAKKALITVELNKRSIAHEVEAKFSAAHIRIKPASVGHGMRAGGAARVVLSLAGIKDVTAKTLGRTPNKLTNALAAIKALSMLAPLKK
jgi:small subunit ribosomal protein S5